MPSVWSVAGAVLAAIGGGGAIVLALSSWLGKVWATRIMQGEAAKHNRELASLRADLESANQAALAAIEDRLKFDHEKMIGAHQDKLVAYRAAIDVVAPLLADVSMYLIHRDNAQLAASARRFEENRLRVYGYLAILAPQPVMDAQDELIDYILSVLYDNAPYDWTAVRARVLKLIEEIRKDIGIDPTPITYRGKR